MPRTTWDHAKGVASLTNSTVWIFGMNTNSGFFKGEVADHIQPATAIYTLGRGVSLNRVESEFRHMPHCNYNILE